MATAADWGPDVACDNVIWFRWSETCFQSLREEQNEWVERCWQASLQSQPDLQASHLSRYQCLGRPFEKSELPTACERFQTKDGELLMIHARYKIFFTPEQSNAKSFLARYLFRYVEEKLSIDVTLPSLVRPKHWLFSSSITTSSLGNRSIWEEATTKAVATDLHQTRNTGTCLVRHPASVVANLNEMHRSSLIEGFRHLSGIGVPTITAVFQVQNLAWEWRYDKISKRIDNEQTPLYHGIQATHLPLLLQLGLTRTFCGGNYGAEGGEGIYLTPRLAWACLYAGPQCQKNTRIASPEHRRYYILVCRALLGKTTSGSCGQDLSTTTEFNSFSNYKPDRVGEAAIAKTTPYEIVIPRDDQVCIENILEIQLEENLQTMKTSN